jgi:hypothetical protein
LTYPTPSDSLGGGSTSRGGVMSFDSLPPFLFCFSRRTKIMDKKPLDKNNGQKRKTKIKNKKEKQKKQTKKKNKNKKQK